MGAERQTYILYILYIQTYILTNKHTHKFWKTISVNQVCAHSREGWLWVHPWFKKKVLKQARVMHNTKTQQSN